MWLPDTKLPAGRTAKACDYDSQRNAAPSAMFVGGTQLHGHGIGSMLPGMLYL